MSDTPRTDAEQWTPKKGAFPVVEADFARELERELAASIAYAVALKGALGSLHAMVWGECPSLLNEDSGGSAHLDAEIRALLERPEGVDIK